MSLDAALEHLKQSYSILKAQNDTNNHQVLQNILKAHHYIRLHKIHSHERNESYIQTEILLREELRSDQTDREAHDALFNERLTQLQGDRSSVVGRALIACKKTKDKVDATCPFSGNPSCPSAEAYIQSVEDEVDLEPDTSSKM